MKPVYHGGPIETLPSSDPSKQQRGLKQTNPTPELRSKVIMSNGKPLMPERLSKILKDIMAARERLDALPQDHKPYAKGRVTRDVPEASRPGGVPINAQSTARTSRNPRTNQRDGRQASGSRIPVAKAGARVP